MDLTLKVWRQKGPDEKGRLEEHRLTGISPDMSFLEMLDELNEKLVREGKEPVAFEHDCREGICGACGLVINGQPHGPGERTTTCQLHIRHFRAGDTITIEPWRATGFPVIKDLIVDRSAFDRIIQSHGYISVSTGRAPDAHSQLVPKQSADQAMDAAECIGCGACVAACPNGSAMLFVAAKVSHLASLPQGGPEAAMRVRDMSRAMFGCGFGNCSNHYECEAACPKGINLKFIAKLNREYMKSWARRK
ncbi:MAG: succinate dehydrogenase/fumarate reductase iron-sulfur subunit [Thermodesulfobacteriota bacterium]